MNETLHPRSLTTTSSRRRPVLDWLSRAVDNWRQRHRVPFNFWIHLVGIPLAMVGLFLFLVVDWYWALGAFVLGYVLQYIGHRVEGNDLGEWAGIKRLLGLPYVGIAPQWQRTQEQDR